jgi:hypothetical protein
MSQEPSASNLVERLLELEAQQESDAAALAEATGRVSVRLHQLFARLVGSHGCDLLLARAVSVAAAADPRLTGIRWQPGAAPALEGLRERLEAYPPDEARQACSTLLGAFLSLLFRFIGPAVTVRQVNSVWPGLANDESGAEDAK